MKDKVRIVILLVAAATLAVLGLAGYFGWVNIAYVDTLHAQVDGSLVTVRSPGAATVLELPIALGDSVEKGEELGLLEVVGASTKLLWPALAPSDGVIVARMADVGQILSAGQPFATIVDPDALWVTANIHQSRVPQVRVGQVVRIKIVTRSLRRRFWGRVEQIGQATNAAVAGSGSMSAMGPAAASISQPAEVPVRISIDPAGQELLPGMRAEVRIHLNPRGR